MRPYKILITLIAVALFGAGFAYVIAPAPQLLEERIQSSTQESTSTQKTLEEIDTSLAGSPSPASPASSDSEVTSEQAVPVKTSYVIPILTQATVLQAMEAYAAIDSGFFFSGHDFPGLGLFVEEIGGLKNRDGFYWTLFINNTLSEKGASTVNANPGDVVEWRYQKGI